MQAFAQTTDVGGLSKSGQDESSSPLMKFVLGDYSTLKCKQVAYINIHK